jgi:hypothetical protein
MSLPIALVPLLLADQGPDPAALLGFLAILLIVFGIALAVGMLISGLILQLGCRIIGTRAPSLGGAMGIELVVFILNSMVGIGLAFAATMGAANHGRVGPEALLQAGPIINLISILLGAVVSAGLYSSFLDNVSLGGGLLIWLIKMSILFLIGIAVVMFIFVLALLVAIGSGGMR